MHPNDQLSRDRDHRSLLGILATPQPPATFPTFATPNPCQTGREYTEHIALLIVTIDINDFAYPAAFTPGNSGRNIMTGTRLLWAQLSAQKNWAIKERARLQLRWDFQNPW